MSDDRKLAMFMDFENIVRGVKEAQYKQFEIKLVLERLVEKGKIMVKRAYADWNRYAEYKRPFHEHAIELIDVPQSRYSGKNSADIRMVVDAMDLAYAKQHVDSFALVSGDSDFSPLVSKLRENDRYVIGLGVKSSSSELLVGNCDEFIFYEDPPAREQGHPLGLHGQADHAAQEPRLQRVLLRLPDLLEAARRCGEAEDRDAGAGRAKRDLHHHVARGRQGRIGIGVRIRPGRGAGAPPFTPGNHVYGVQGGAPAPLPGLRFAGVPATVFVVTGAW